ncbi:unnamed protein product [Amoebophrya sp. A25]|nr:unnamed protein product [Amoebophrya sp. A25]|eukprot:GSA25T00021096001.1
MKLPPKRKLKHFFYVYRLQLLVVHFLLLPNRFCFLFASSLRLTASSLPRTRRVVEDDCCIFGEALSIKEVGRAVSDSPANNRRSRAPIFLNHNPHAAPGILRGASPACSPLNNGGGDAFAQAGNYLACAMGSPQNAAPPNTAVSAIDLAIRQNPHRPVIAGTRAGYVCEHAFHALGTCLCCIPRLFCCCFGDVCAWFTSLQFRRRYGFTNMWGDDTHFHV